MDADLWLRGLLAGIVSASYSIRNKAHLNVYALATGAASPGYTLVPRAGSPGYTFVPRAGSPQYTPVIGLVALIR